MNNYEQDDSFVISDMRSAYSVIDVSFYQWNIFCKS